MPWMSDLYYDNALAHSPRGTFRNRPLSWLTLPGTHASGAYRKQWISGYEAQTQEQDVYQQLADGVRYLDIHPCLYNNGFWVYRGTPDQYIGARIDGIDGILSQVASFMASLAHSDRELVVLNFSHFSGFSNSSHANLLGQIQGALQEFLVPVSIEQVNAARCPYWQLLTEPEYLGYSYEAIPSNKIRSRVLVLYDGAMDTPRESYISSKIETAPLGTGIFTVGPKYTGHDAAHTFYLFSQASTTEDLGTQSSMPTDQYNKLTQRQNYACSQADWASDLGISNLWGANTPANPSNGIQNALHVICWDLGARALGVAPILLARDIANPSLQDFFQNTQSWNGKHYDATLSPCVNVLLVDDYASHRHRNPSSPWHGLALPVALAARTNVGPIGPASTW
ncbi:hypothetical protein KIK84_04760 [Curvibacter sp. CHRR-16]|uniref:hypothetical protein n=1 Tax=Curvibacter sp. CHRR-16 TaxID=2835872 RepID=UPI001BDB3140|nr:hypothetical protein [Curvibacter sp. CHRR-16]MBT0569624.1 hypothetical protein [Curvibacter sp. CHRR-16]